MPNLESTIRAEILRIIRDELQDIFRAARGARKPGRPAGSGRRRGPGRPRKARTAPAAPASAATLKPREIRAIRKKLGLSQKKFGDLIGGSLSSVVNWEKGRSTPRAATVKKILASRNAKPAPAAPKAAKKPARRGRPRKKK